MYVQSVTPDIMAARAGLGPGDIILTIDGEGPMQPLRLNRVLATARVGSVARYLRGEPGPAVAEFGGARGTENSRRSLTYPRGFSNSIVTMRNISASSQRGATSALVSIRQSRFMSWSPVLVDPRV